MAQAKAQGTHVAAGLARPGARRLERILERVPSADRLTIAALLLVVGVVSIPLLRTHALRQNEVDALRSLTLLAAPLATLVEQGRAPTTIAGLVELEPDLARRLSDAELLDGGRLLRRHGYLFDLAPSLPNAGAAGPVLRAWPWRRGRTGLGAFVHDGRGGLLGHANREALWSGPNPPPRPGDAAASGWRRLDVGVER